MIPVNDINRTTGVSSTIECILTESVILI